MTERRDERGDREGRRSLQQELSKEPDELLENKEPISRKIEKVTEELLSEWEISEDDFEETGDLTETSRRLAEEVIGRREGEMAGKNVRSIREEGAVREKSGRPQRADSRSTAPASGRDIERREAAAREGRAEYARKPERRSEGAKGSAPERRAVQRSEERKHSAQEQRPVRRNGQDKRSAGERSASSERGLSESRTTRRSDGSAAGTEYGASSRREGSRRAERLPESRERRPGRTNRGRSASGRRKGNAFLRFWDSLQTMDKVVGLTGIGVCLVAAITFSIVLNARGVNRQVETFAQVGENLSQIAVADESTFLGVADGHLARQQAASAQETEEYNEKEDDSEIQVGLNMTSVEKDLKIKFVNRKTGKLIPYVAFEAEIKGPDETYQKTDDDKDGIIYLTGITGGTYTVRVTGPEGLEGYILPEDAQSVEVKNQIAYEKIDVSDEIKSESEVNAAKEDTEIKTEVESVLQDTVEWVESTKTPIGGDGNAYIEVKKADVPDPAASASLDFGLFAGVRIRPAQMAGLAIWSQPAEAGMMHLSTVAEPTSTVPEPEEPSSTEPTQTVPEEPKDVAVTGVEISPKELSGTVGGSGSLSASVKPDDATNKGVKWSSSDTGVATVDGSGTVSFVGAGSATITVTTDEGSHTASASVKVVEEEKKVEKVEVTGDGSVSVGGSITLSATISPSGASYDGVSWSSSDSSIATVDGGKVTGVKAGSVTVTATAGGVSGSKTVEVKNAEVAVGSIKINGSTSAKKGETVQLSITAEPAGADASVKWESSNPSVASVDGNGKVTAKETGSTTIKATSLKDGSKTASITFTVTSNETNSATLSDMKITAGETKGADLKTTGSVSSKSFSIANTKYATVDGSGNIRAIRSGETELTVTVKFSNGETVTKKAKLTVAAAEVKKITLDKTSVTLKVGESLKLNPTIETTGYTGCLWYTSDASIVTVTEHGNGTIKAVKAGKVTITACSSEDTSKKATCEVTVTGKDLKDDTTTKLKDKDGKQLYVKNADGKYVEAVVADYYKYDVFYRLNENVEYKYTGWQTIDGKRYYFDKDGNKVTGEQVIQGVKYNFGSDGALSGGSGVLGIDVSKHNGNINWTEVKNSGVSFVIIRCGYRGSSTGAMIEDPKFKANIQGATAAGLKVGVYFFSQAVNRVEAVEEASMTLELIKGYKISYPVFLDVEASGGRADGIDSGTRTEIVNAYCETIRNSGYTAGVYANKTWLNSKMNTGSFGSNKIWLAQYAAAPTYNGRYEMWQYSSTGKIGGISGNVDLNLSYLGY